MSALMQRTLPGVASVRAGLCVAIGVSDGALRDWVSGAPPSALITPAVGLDDQGRQTMRFSGSGYTAHEFAPTGLQEKPSVAITVYCRYLLTTVNHVSSGLFTKYHTVGSSPNTTWAFLINTVNTTQITSRLTVAGTANVVGPSVALGTTSWVNLWLRWQSGETASVDYLGDAGNVLDTQDVSGVLTGTVSYPATPNPIRVGGSQDTAKASPGGDFSAGMVWNRRLSDQEMNAVTLDPFALLRRG